MTTNNPEVEIQLDTDLVEKSVTALFQYAEKKQGKSQELFDSAELLLMQLTFQKIPISTHFQIIHVNLDHSLLQANNDVCLFVKDLSKRKRDYSDTVNHFKELLQEHNVTCITEVMPLKQITTEYTTYESKRNLSDMFDFYLCDRRILRVLSPNLGKNFARKKIFPVTVDLLAEDLKKEIDRALTLSLCPITARGSTCMMKVAHTGMTSKQALANITTAINTLAASIPGGAVNIKSLHLKTVDSPAIPIYKSKGSPNDVKLPEPPAEPEWDEPEDVTTVEGAKVVVSPDGEIHIIPDGMDFDPSRYKPRPNQLRKIQGTLRSQPPKRARKSNGSPDKKRKRPKLAAKEDATVHDTTDSNPEDKQNQSPKDKKSKKNASTEAPVGKAETVKPKKSAKDKKSTKKNLPTETPEVKTKTKKAKTKVVSPKKEAKVSKKIKTVAQGSASKQYEKKKSKKSLVKKVKSA